MSCGAVAVCLLLSGWLSGHGYDAPRRDAVLAYVGRESGFDPDVVTASGACLFQWAGARRREVLMLGEGRCPSWEAQVELADRELRTTFAGFWRSRHPAARMRECFGKGIIYFSPLTRAGE